MASTHVDEPAETTALAGGRLLAAVSNAIVRIYAHGYGRGPTRAISHWAGPDTIVCVTRDIFDAGEATLVDLGHGGDVRHARACFRDGMERVFVRAVEGIVGRKVNAHMGQVTTSRPEYGAEIFTFEPDPKTSDWSGEQRRDEHTDTRDHAAAARSDAKAVCGEAR